MDKDVQDNEKPSQDAPRFTIFRGKDAKDYGAHNLQRVEGMTPVIAEGLGHYIKHQAEASPSKVTLVYGAPGFSLTKVWFKSFYPLPLHSHDSDCLYYILAGSVKLGTEELGPGDGFFVGRNVPYTYITGPEGVEVLEFRDSDDLNIRFMSKNKATWEKAAAKMEALRETWIKERPPSEVTAE